MQDAARSRIEAAVKSAETSALVQLVEGIGPKLDTMKQMLAQGRGSAQQRERFEFVTVQYEMAVNELERRS